MEPIEHRIDRLREEFDAEDQTASADMDVLPWFIGFLLLMCFCAWVYAGMPGLAHV